MIDDAITRLQSALADRYRIERELGAGGMATVYLARDLKHDREVAIKVLREDLAASLGAGRFLREIKIAAQLQHPHILPLLDSGESGPFLYFVMPYIKGQSLRERLGREGELPVHEAIRLITEVVDALVEAHSHGVVHRDIKPDNVMLSGRHALVTDFGVAKAISEATGRNTITTMGVAVGTPTYMSPEQAAADPHVDHRADIYSVGVMAYEMLCGRPPFVGGSPQQVLASHVTEVPDPVSKRRNALPPAIEQVVMRCLAKRPADRYQTAVDLLAALEPLATPSTGMTPTVVRPVDATRTSASRKWIALGVTALVATTIGVFASRFTGKAAHPRVQLGERTQLTFTGHVGVSAISDDGKSIAYAVDECTDGTCASAIEVKEVGARDAHRVIDHLETVTSVFWSPDRRTLLFRGGVNGKSGIYLISMFGGTPTPVAGATGNVDFVTADSLVTMSQTTLSNRWIGIGGLDGIAHDRIVVADSAENLIVVDVMAVPESHWFVITLSDAAGRLVYRTIDRKGRRVGDTRLDGTGFNELMSRDALWRMTFIGFDRRVLVRFPFEPARGTLSAVGDTLYQGTAALFNITRDGTIVLLNDGSTTYETWALDANDALAGRFTDRRRLASATTLSQGFISPEGSHVAVMQDPLGAEPRVSLRSFDSGTEIPLALPPSLRSLSWADANTLAYRRRDGTRSQLGLVDVRTGVIHDTLTIADSSIVSTWVPPDEWVWWTPSPSAAAGMRRRRGETAPRRFTLPPDIIAEAAVPLTGRRGLAFSGVLRASLDTSVVVVTDTIGGAGTTWLRIPGDGAMAIADRPMGYVMGGLEGTVIVHSYVVRIDAPGQSKVLGSIARPVLSASTSSDMRRIAITTVDFHGDAWLLRVTRK